jgi:hypothetical protein
MIDNQRIWHMIEGLLKFPYPQICRHAVALDLLSLIEESGEKLDPTFVKAVSQAEDDVALNIINKHGSIV